MLQQPISISRIPMTHKTYKNKIKDNNNKADLWKKINESFDIDIDKKKFKKDETSVECIYRNSGQRKLRHMSIRRLTIRRGFSYLH